MKKYIYVLAMVAAVIADDDRVEKLFINATNQFSSKMFSQVAKANAGKSMVMSGFSAMSPLAQLGLASVGESHDEILGTMGLRNDNVTKEVFSFVSEKITNVKDLSIVNRIYLPKGYKLNEEFAAVSRDVFRSDVKQLDFLQNKLAAETVNKWVENKTNHRIKDLISPAHLGPSTQIVLINAVYFKGNWKIQFDNQMTRDRSFHVNKYTKIEVPTMYIEDYFKIGNSKELNAKLLELPFEGEESSFLILLPNEIEGLGELQEKLKDTAVLQRAIGDMEESEVSVFLPKFKIETTIDLKDVLKKIGVNKLFDADQSRLENLLSGVKTGLSITDALQKAFIEINEDGAEAAGASGYISYRSSPPSFVADRPFLFMLNIKSVPLFSGIYSP